MEMTNQDPLIEVLFFGVNNSLLSAVKGMLGDAGYRVSAAEWNEGKKNGSFGESVDVIIYALSSDGGKDESVLQSICAACPSLPVIAIINEGQDERGLQAIGKGVQDVLVSNELSSALLRRTIRFSMERMLSRQIKEDSDRLFGIMLEYGQDIITLMSGEGTIIYESPNIERLAGYKPEELIGRNIAEIVLPEDHGLLAEKIAESLRNSKKPIFIKTKFSDKAGQWRDVEAVGRNFIDDPAAGCIVINARVIQQ
jgi:PAS domain S-box-containing protein